MPKLTKTKELLKRLDHIISLLRKEEVNVYIWRDHNWPPKRPQSEIVFHYSKIDDLEKVYKTLPLDQAFYFLLDIHEKIIDMSEVEL